MRTKKKLVGGAVSVLAMLLLALATALPGLAQGTPEVNYPIHFGVSPPLSEIATQGAPQPGFHLAPPVRYPQLELLNAAAERGQAPVADGALQTYAGPLVNATLGLNLLGVGNGFPGYSVPDAPTDVNLAVGDSQVVQWVNVSFAIFNKTTGATVAGPIAGNTLWSSLGGACASNNDGDIIAQWDKIAHRWLLAQNVFANPYYTCVAVSQTADATGSYYLYQFNQPGFPDYPKWGVWPDAYYQSQNNFGAGGSGFIGARPCAYNRAKMLVGDSTAEQICFQNTTTSDDSMLPGDLDSANTLPPTGQDEVYLGSIDTGSSNVYEYLFHVDFAIPSNSTFTGVGDANPISVAAFSLLCGGNGSCVQEPGGNTVDSLGDRLMYRLAYRNFSDHQTWLVSHAVTAGSSGGERWYEFHAPENSTSLSVFQQGTFAPDSSYRWMGSIAMDSAQDIALAYSVSSSSVDPSIYYTGRVLSDPSGSMESEALIVAGTGAQTDTSSRWGDYTSMAIDETDDCTFWYTNQYYMTTASFDWSTQLASFKFANCGSTTPDFYLSTNPSTQTINPGGSTSYSVTVNPLNGYSNTVTLSLSGCPSGATCSISPSSVGPPYSASTLSVSTTSSIALGTYTITITGTDGTLTHTTTVNLVVTGVADFSISAQPVSLTLKRGSLGTYTAIVTAVNGFNGVVALSVSGLPANTTGTFNPASVTGHGNSHLNIATTKKTPTGTFTLTIKGTSGSLSHSKTVSLTVTTH